MIDWKSTFNIVFVTAALALIVFLLISTIVVAVKGKRKCGAFDVILRIVATLAFIGSTAMFVFAILAMLDGDFCVAIVDGVPLLVAWNSVTVLPMPELFVFLSATIGSEISAVLFVCSLVALICDCLIANKKTDKAEPNADKVPPAKKSPEQLKAEAEIARIKRLGDAAVKKADAAVKSQERIVQKQEPEAEEQEIDSVERPTAEAPDWREEQDSRNAEFVGVKDEYDEFDNFDSEFDEAEGAYSDASAAEHSADADYEEDTYADADYEEDTYIENGDDIGERETPPDDVRSDEPKNVENESYGGQDLRDVEPDRDIYIPEMQTYVRRGTQRVKSAAPSATARAAQKSKATAESKHAVGNRSSDKKPSDARKPSGKSESIPDAKKLPLTRRYVILDRRNAVNMFGEYLKERNKADKDKLTSSINTIIIE